MVWYGCHKYDDDDDDNFPAVVAQYAWPPGPGGPEFKSGPGRLQVI